MLRGKSCRNKKKTLENQDLSVINLSAIEELAEAVG